MDFDGQLKRKPDRVSGDEPPNIEISLSLIEQSLRNIETTQKRHGEILFGRDEAKGGLILEVDRLKEHRKNTEKTTFAAWAAFIGVIMKTGWDAVFGK